MDKKLFNLFILALGAISLNAMERPNAIVPKDFGEAVSSENEVFPFQSMPKDLKNEVIFHTFSGDTLREAWENFAAMLQTSSAYASLMENENFRRKVVKQVDQKFGMESIYEAAENAYHIPRLAHDFAKFVKDEFSEESIDEFLEDLSDTSALLEGEDDVREYSRTFARTIGFAALLKPNFLVEENNDITLWHQLLYKGTFEMLEAVLKEPNKCNVALRSAEGDRDPLLLASLTINLEEGRKKIQLLREHGADVAVMKNESNLPPAFADICQLFDFEEWDEE